MRASDRVIVDVVAGSAANEAVLASNANAVAKGTDFIVCLSVVSDAAVHSCTLRRSCPAPADIFGSDFRGPSNGWSIPFPRRDDMSAWRLETDYRMTKKDRADKI
jgi:hypothetical protein